MQDEPKIKWTEREVRQRLEDFSLDDSLYDVQAVRLSFMKIGRSSAEDAMTGKVYKLLKRDELRRAMSYLLSPGKTELDNQDKNEYAFMFYLIQLRYIHIPVMKLSEIRHITGKPWSTLKDQENKAIGLITGFLNTISEKDNTCAVP